MSKDFLEWYNEKYPENNWSVEDLMVYDSWHEYLDRETHQEMCWDAWCAAIGNAKLRGWIQP